VVGDRFAIGVEQLAALAAPRVGQSHARGIAGQIDQRDACGGHFVIVGIALGVLADVAALQNHGPQARRATCCRLRNCWNRLPARRDLALRTT